jgi:hypothetical protein
MRWIPLLLLTACTEPSVDLSPDAGPTLDFQLIDAQRDAPIPPDLAPDQRPPIDAAADGLPPDAAPDLGIIDASAVCDEDEVRCTPDATTIDLCRGGRWQADPCPDAQICLNDRCLPDPRGCAPTDAVCLAAHQPAACLNDRWQPTEPCHPGHRCRAGHCETQACADAADSGSYLGCEFLAVALPNFAVIYTPGTPMGVVLTNPHDAITHVTLHDARQAPAQLIAEHRVELSEHPAVPEEAPDLYGPETVRSAIRDAQGAIVRDGFAQAVDLEIPPGGTATLLLPPAGPETLQSAVFSLATQVLTDRPVAAYQFNPYCCNFSFSNDASLLFPVAALGQRYRIAALPNFSFEALDSPGGFAIAAPTGPTTVDLQLDAETRVRTLRGPQLRALGQGRYQATLNALDVLLVQTAASEPGSPPPDLTGASISASAPISVFSTHLCTFYPQRTGFCDHLEEQLLPIEAWGQRYALVPPPPRGRAGNDGQRVYYRIIANAPGVTLTLSRPIDDLATAQPGALGTRDCITDAIDPTHLRLDAPCELSIRAPVGLVADAPVQILATLSGQEAVQLNSPFGTRAGDPSLYLLAPERQLRTEYDFLVPTTYALDFVTVTSPANAHITLDGRPLDLALAAPIPGTARVFLHVPIEDGPHHMAGDRPFGIRVTAFDDFVSYAFTGGLDLRKP